MCSVRWWRAAFVLLATALMTVPAAAQGTVGQAWPTRPVKILIPFTAGGTADTLGRLVAQKLSETFGAEFVPENKAGASGLIAAAEAANAAPDGHTLFVSGVGGLIISSAISASPPADVVEGYTHIAFFGGPPAVFLVNNEVPARTLKEFVDYAKAAGTLSYGSPSQGSQANLAAVLFQQKGGFALQHVAYRGASQALNDLIGGHIKVTCTALTSAAGTISGGKVRPLAVTSPGRVADYPDVPTFLEQGYPDLVAEVWFALSGPKGMPPDVVRRLNEAVAKALNSPDARARLAKEAIEPRDMDPAAFAAFYRSENQKWGALAREVIGVQR
jgi:tripartite-type tricarboxylate transporter receptor subunit TctC